MVRDDKDHKRCAPVLELRRERRVVPAPVLVELDHLLGRELGRAAFPALLDTIVAGEFDIEDLVMSDYERAAELMRIYADLRSASSTPRCWRWWSGWESRSWPLSTTATSMARQL